MVLLTLIAMEFYSLSAVWFKRELGRASLELAQQQAAETANVINEALPQPFLADTLGTAAQFGVLTELAKLMVQNHNIVAAFVVDREGRIAVNQIRAWGGALIRSRLMTYRATFGPEWNPNGWLRVFIERQMPQEAVEMAAARITTRLAMVLLALVAIVWLAAAIIGRQQRLARQLRRQRDRAEQLAYVGALAAGLAHEIRNPLNALTMQLEMLEEDVLQGSGVTVKPRLQRIRTGLAGVENTVRDFLTYATPEQQKPSQVEVQSVIEPLCIEYREGVDNNELSLECSAAPGLTAWCDPHALRQILGNLMSNGLRIQDGRPGPHRLRIEAVRNGTWIEITVDDAGPGVAPQNRELIFECFYTTRSDGTGLGLSIARRLAEMNGGGLDLDEAASPMGGARFRIRLPARPPARRSPLGWWG
ncbi:MAG: HAMP domain-containing histidine kinase [bacterium]|nr:HAMP domain-containing histidine kinase [bacterium]